MKKYLRATTEALEQYRTLAVLRLGRLVKTSDSWTRFELIEEPENFEAIDMAIILMTGGDMPVSTVNEEIVLAFQKGDSYLEPLVSRQVLKKESRVALAPEARAELDELDNMLLKGIP